MFIKKSKIYKIFVVLLVVLIFTNLFACDFIGGDITNDGSHTGNSSSCVEHIDSNNDNFCDNCGQKIDQSKCNHSDKDSDGYCDLCLIEVEVTFNLISINDLHGKFYDSSKQPGVDELTTYLKKQKSLQDNCVIFSSGDIWQGTAESGLTFGNLMTDWMNDVGFSFMTIGNHEFDWGSEYIKQNSQIANFPFLAINIYDRKTNELAEYCQPSLLVDFNDFQVGFIGAIGDCYSSIASDMSTDVYFKVKDDLTNLVKNESQRLRSLGADFIVYSIHDGFEGSGTYSHLSDGELKSYYNTQLSDGYVDLVFEGHTHQSYVLTDMFDVYHLQGGGENSGISSVTVSINLITNENSVFDAKIVSKDQYKNYKADNIVNSLTEKYYDKIGTIYQPLGNNSKNLNSDDLGYIMADLYVKLGEKVWKDYDIVLGGGFLNLRSPYNLYVGQVDYAMLYSLFPFNNRLALCSISGNDLKSKFINNSRYKVAFGQYGNLVKDKIVNSNTYYIVVDSYTYNYAYNNLKVVEDYVQTIYPRDLLADYVKNGGLNN